MQNASAQACCCCVENLQLTDWIRMIPDAFANDADLQMVMSGGAEPGEHRPPTFTTDRRFGHDVATSFVLTYHKSDCDKDCEFEWNEVLNVSLPGWPAGQSRNLVRTRPGDFPTWQAHVQQRNRDRQQGMPCPSGPFMITDRDEPTVVVNPGDSGTRRLAITVIVRSSCPAGKCKNQELKLVFEQKLKVDHGNPDFLLSVFEVH